MPLRNPNNPNTDVAVMQALANVLVGYPTANTAIGVNGGTVAVQRSYDTYQGGFPAVIIWAGRQKGNRSSRSTYIRTLNINVDYYDDYTERSDEFDDIRAALALDLERMLANVESNEQLAQNNTAYTVSLAADGYELSEYEGELVERQGRKLIYRRLTLNFNILPYDV